LAAVVAVVVGIVVVAVVLAVEPLSESPQAPTVVPAAIATAATASMRVLVMMSLLGAGTAPNSPLSDSGTADSANHRLLLTSLFIDHENKDADETTAARFADYKVRDRPSRLSPR
jgi:hypothetical protein